MNKYDMRDAWRCFEVKGRSGYPQKHHKIKIKLLRKQAKILEQYVNNMREKNLPCFNAL